MFHSFLGVGDDHSLFATIDSKQQRLNEVEAEMNKLVGEIAEEESFHLEQQDMDLELVGRLKSKASRHVERKLDFSHKMAESQPRVEATCLKVPPISNLELQKVNKNISDQNYDKQYVKNQHFFFKTCLITKSSWKLTRRET